MYNHGYILPEVTGKFKIEPAERRRLILGFDRVLGLRLVIVVAKKLHAISDEARALIRNEARAARDWKRSDDQHDQLTAPGFEGRDKLKGTELV